jgi:hypothetical protein
LGFILVSNNGIVKRLSGISDRTLNEGGKTMQCAFCGQEVVLADKIMRRDTCPHCSRDLRCCRQCKFYDPHAYNECKEVMADRVLDKERANFCEYFVPIGSSLATADRVGDAREALEALFRK